MIYNDNKILTIIIPCFNAAKYLRRCMSSIGSVDSNEVAIIFINDGSTDDTPTIIQEWIKTHNNAKLISKENGGYSTAINTGLDNCNTKYVMVMGADDEIQPSSLSRICKHLKTNDPDILAFSATKVYDDTDRRSRIEKEVLSHYQHPGYYCTDIYGIWDKLKSDSWILFTRDTARCFKMSVIQNQRYFGKMGVSADGCFSSIIACYAKSYEFLNEDCYLWHLHSDSVSGRKKTLHRIKDEVQVWEDYFKAIREIIGDNIIPGPIFSQLVSYRRTTYALKAHSETELYRKHRNNTIKIRLWMLRNRRTPLKSRLYVLFPDVYEYIVQHYKGK